MRINYSIQAACQKHYSNYSQILNTIFRKVPEQTLELQRKNVNCLTFVAPRLIVVTEAEAATVIFSEESAWWRTLQSNVTEDMIIWRIERIPLRASNKCFWSTLTKSLNWGKNTYYLLRFTNGYLLDLSLFKGVKYLHSLTWWYWVVGSNKQ